MKRRPNRVSLAIAAAVIVISGAGVWWWNAGKPGPTRAQTVVSAAAKSGDFASVSREIAAGKLSREDVRVAVREEFERQTLERVDAFFTTSDAAQRRSILDRAIDDLERFRAEGRKRAAAAASQPVTPQSVADDPRLAMAAWALSQPPATRARLAEFRVAMEKRRSERGLPGLFDGGRLLPLGRG